MDRVRLEKLDSKHNTISIIYPDSYNIHEIKSSPVQQSAFIDLLVPEYPDNACNYFETIDEKGKNSISLKKIPEAKEEIIGLDTLIKIFKEKASGSGKPKMPQPIRHPGQSWYIFLFNFGMSLLSKLIGMLEYTLINTFKYMHTAPVSPGTCTPNAYKLM